MNKYSRNMRVSAITKMLIENPNKVTNLNNFVDLLGAAKSTISEDIVVIKDTLLRMNAGKIDTVSGAAGGVKYICGLSKEEIKKFTEQLCAIYQR